MHASKFIIFIRHNLLKGYAMNFSKLLLLLLAPVAVLAQNDASESRSPFDKGGTLIGGLASFTSESAGNDTRTTVAIAPSAVFFVGNGIGIGFDMSFTSVSVDNASQSIFAAGPKVMLAFGTAESNVYPYLGAGVDFITMSSDQRGFSSSSASGSIIKGGVGLMFKVSRHIGIPLELGVLVTNIGDNKDAITTIAVGTGIAGLLY